MKHEKIRVITDGSIIVAFYALFLLCSRLLGIMEDFLYFMIPIPLSIYAYKYQLKNSLLVAISTVLISFIIINPLSALFYVLPTVLVGLIYPEMLKRKIKFRYVIIFLTFIFLLISTLTMVVFGYLFNYDIVEDTKLLAESILSLFSFLGLNSQYFKAILIALIPSILILTSIMEAILLDFIVKIVLKRLKLNTDLYSYQFSIDFLPSIIGYIYIIVFILMIFSIWQIPLNTDLFYLYSIILNIGIIFSFFMIYQGLYFLFHYAKMKKKSFICFLGIISVIIFPLGIIVIGFLQNILHLTLKLEK